MASTLVFNSTSQFLANNPKLNSVKMDVLHHVSSNPTGVATFVVLGLVAVATAIYRAMLPKPIPGIPYRKASAKRILGDAIEVSDGPLGAFKRDPNG